MEEQTEQKEEKLELVFGTEKLLDSAKEPFIGKVTSAEFPCHCEECEKGARKLEEMQKAEGQPVSIQERLHILITPLTVFTEHQRQWWNPTKTKLSRWGDLQKQLEKLGIIDKFKTEREKAFIGMVAEWNWVPVAEVGVSTIDRAVFHWLPVRILTEDEIANIGSAKPSTSDEPSETSSVDVREGTKLD